MEKVFNCEACCVDDLFTVLWVPPFISQETNVIYAGERLQEFTVTYIPYF